MIKVFEFYESNNTFYLVLIKSNRSAFILTVPLLYCSGSGSGSVSISLVFCCGTERGLTCEPKERRTSAGGKSVPLSSVSKAIKPRRVSSQHLKAAQSPKDLQSRSPGAQESWGVRVQESRNLVIQKSSAASLHTQAK